MLRLMFPTSEYQAAQE